jgi:hypothetical protein
MFFKNFFFVLLFTTATFSNSFFMNQDGKEDKPKTQTSSISPKSQGSFEYWMEKLFILVVAATMTTGAVSQITGNC